MNLVIEDTQEHGPNGLPVITVAHYGEQNGDLMRDPEMLFEMEKSGETTNLVPFHWRNESGKLFWLVSLWDWTPTTTEVCRTMLRVAWAIPASPAFRDYCV